MSIDDIGARRLIASILKKASDDYANDKGCPECKDSCEQNKFDANHCDAKRFIHSSWCEILCDGLNINHKEYVAVCIKKHRLSMSSRKSVSTKNSAD